MPAARPPRTARRALLGAGLAAVALAAAAPAAAEPPRLALLVTQDRVVAGGSPDMPEPVPAVAYLVNRGGPVDVELRRAPGTARWEAVATVDGVRTSVPATVPIGPRGLGRAVTVTVLDARRAVVRRSELDVCLDLGALRLGPRGPALSSFPSSCSDHPFARGLRQGLDTDYGVPVWLAGAIGILRPGSYTIRVTMRQSTAEWLGMRPPDRAATIAVRVRRDPATAAARGGADRIVVTLPGGVVGAAAGRPRRARPAPRARATVPAPPPADGAPADALPNLIALPAYDFAVRRSGRRDMLDFAATVWNEGPGPLIVEGHRRSAARWMDAYQFIRRDGADVAALPVGILHYDARRGHDHWHFRDFARYSIVRPDGTPAAVSPKEAWCLAPTDQIDQLVPNAELRPGDGLLESACGEADAVHVREVLEVGAGDTYGLGTPGQAIDITRLPNGPYLLRTEANPSGALHETTRADDVADRPIVLGGRPGRRTVHAPPIDGIDTERR